MLANNDAPTGAAIIPLEAQLPADWEGWTAGEGGETPRKKSASAGRPKRTVAACAEGTSSPQQQQQRQPQRQRQQQLGIRTPPAKELLRIPAVMPLPAAGSSRAIKEEAWQRSPAGSSKRALRQRRPPAWLSTPFAGEEAARSSASADAAAGCAAQEQGAVEPTLLVRFGGNQAAAHAEAERQLSLLSQLRRQLSFDSGSAPAGLPGPGPSACATSHLRVVTKCEPGALALRLPYCMLIWRAG